MLIRSLATCGLTSTLYNGEERSVTNGRSQLALSSILAVLIPIIFPLVHMLIFLYLWGDLTHPVDRRSCTCSCWDTLFKGPYETGVAKYKHVYFNGTWNVFKMWIITVMGVIVLYECFKSIFQLILLRRLRLTMLILFLSSLHSHYYAWWGHWNYWNDEFYDQWYHQVFYTLSELVCSAIVVNYFDRQKPIRPLPILLVANISLFHIISSGWDQFCFTVIQQQGHLHQVLRDILLMLTDLIHTAVTFYELRKYSRNELPHFTMLLTQKKHVAAVVVTTSIMCLMVTFFP